jgi:hypothetical protein
MIKNFFSLIGVRSPFHLHAIAKKEARSRGLFAGAIAGDSTLCLDNSGNEGR